MRKIRKIKLTAPVDSGPGRKAADRSAVLTLLRAKHDHLTPAEIAKRLKGVAHTATVYRAIKELAHHGLIRRVDVEGRAARYEAVRWHHHHVVCTSCGFVENVDVCVSDGTIETLAKRARGFSKISAHTLEFFGLCTRCV